jgi:hypothetical protein
MKTRKGKYPVPKEGHYIPDPETSKLYKNKCTHARMLTPSEQESLREDARKTLELAELKWEERRLKGT